MVSLIITIYLGVGILWANYVVYRFWKTRRWDENNRATKFFIIFFAIHLWPWSILVAIRNTVRSTLDTVREEDRE